MRIRLAHWGLAIIAIVVAGCTGGSSTVPLPTPPPPPPPPPPPATAEFGDVSASNLPATGLAGQCMDADHGDLDGDGDADLVLAQEFGFNLVLLNNGSGSFSILNGAVTAANGDNEDLRLGDFDNDNDLDMLTVHEDDQVHALLLNDGTGTFTESVGAIPVNSIANATELIDLDGNGRLDILIGNQGPNLVIMQQVNGTFVNDTVNNPIGFETTQDLLLIDVDGDNDQDLYVANERGNALFINDGSGGFTDDSMARLPTGDGETREADAADVDNDGDLDIVLGNVNFNFSRPIANQLLLNDGSGTFTEVTANNLASVPNSSSSFTIRFVDIDADGDPDIISPQSQIGQSGNVVVWVNDGTGVFAPPAQAVFSVNPSGSTFDIEVFDANGDGRDDLYFCNRTGTDQLYLRN